MNMSLKNITFSLPESYIVKLRTFSKNDTVPSMNAAIRQALDDYFKKLEKQKIYDLMKDATTDVAFMNDIGETMDAYAISDSENTGGNEDW